MARDFDGASDVITLGDIALDGATTFAISFWVNWDSTSGQDVPFSKFVGAGDRIEFIQDNTHIIVVVANGSNTYGSSAAPPISSANVWYHVLWWYDGGGGTNADRLKIYWDGVEISLNYTGTIPSSLSTNAASALIGNGAGGSFFGGQLAEFAIWTGLPGGMAAADAAAILAKGYSPAHLRRNGLHYYPLIGRHSPEIDLWGGNAGTLTGTTAFAHPRVFMRRGRRPASAAATVPPPETLFAQACL